MLGYPEKAWGTETRYLDQQRERYRSLFQAVTKRGHHFHGLSRKVVTIRFLDESSSTESLLLDFVGPVCNLFDLFFDYQDVLALCNQLALRVNKRQLGREITFCNGGIDFEFHSTNGVG